MILTAIQRFQLRKERNLLLYTPGTGILDVGNAVRTKPDNAHYKAILAIKFKNLKTLIQAFRILKTRKVKTGRSVVSAHDHKE
jgi:hypothetical protein